MSEQILESLVNLFAIICKVDGQNEEEREVVRSFLYQQLSVEDTERYMKMFDEYVGDTPSSKIDPTVKTGRTVTVRDSARMLLICSQINEEMTQQQKITLVFALFSVIMADGEFTAVEYEFMTTAADIFNISSREFALIEQFAMSNHLDKHESADLLIISFEQEPVYAKTRHIYAESIQGHVAIMRLPDIEMYMIKYVGSGEYYVNNLLLKPGEVQHFSSGSTVRSAKLRPIYYSDVVSRFLSEQQGSQVIYEAKNITYKFPNGRIGLHEFDFTETSGTLVGIMGPSGAGKSTLLEILNSNKTPTSGQVLINGIDIHRQKDKIEGVIGYVPQDDLLMEDLTVFENLFYAARLCFGHLKREELEEIVHKTLMSLGISQIANLRVGSPMQKTISGGERKRVNIGLELLRRAGRACLPMSLLRASRQATLSTSWICLKGLRLKANLFSW